jgi:hypothetical protein
MFLNKKILAYGAKVFYYKIDLQNNAFYDIVIL